MVTISIILIGTKRAPLNLSLKTNITLKCSHYRGISVKFCLQIFTAGFSFDALNLYRVILHVLATLQVYYFCAGI